MEKTHKAFLILFIIGIIYAFLSPLALLAFLVFGFGIGLVLAYIFLFGIYFGMNAVLCAVVGALAGFHLKTRFYAPFVIAVATLPLLFFAGSAYLIILMCAGITLAAGLIAMTISAIKNRLTKKILKD